MNTTERQVNKIKVTQKEFYKIKKSALEKCRKIKVSATKKYVKIKSLAEEERYKKIILAWKKYDKLISKYDVVEN